MLVLQRVLFFLKPSTKSWKFLLPFCLQKKGREKAAGVDWGGGCWFDFRSPFLTNIHGFYGRNEVIMKVLFGPENLNKKLPQRNTWKLQNKGKWKNPPFLKRLFSKSDVLCIFTPIGFICSLREEVTPNIPLKFNSKSPVKPLRKDHFRGEVLVLWSQSTFDCQSVFQK